MDKYRFDFNTGEYDIFKRYCDFTELEKAALKFGEDSPFYTIINKINNPRIIKNSSKKSLAAAKASEKKIEQSKERIEDSITKLRFDNKKITYYSISKEGKLSLNTVKKYITPQRIESLSKLTSP